VIDTVIDMNSIELFFYTWRFTAGAFFSFFGFLWVLVKLGLSVYNAISARAKTDQRHVFQAGYFDVQEDRQKQMLNLYIQAINRINELEKLQIKHEINHIN